MKLVDCANKLLRQTTGTRLDSAVNEAGTLSKCAEPLLEALEPQCVGLGMSVPQRFGARCGKEVSQLKHFSVENNPERTGRFGERCSRFALQRERRGVVPIILVVVASIGKHHLPLYSIERAEPEKIGLKKMATES